MSWGFTIQTTAETAMQDIKNYVLDTSTYGADFAREEAEEQIAVAKAAATYILHSGVLGSEGTYSISFTGHAEPNHVRRPGYAGDALSIGIYRTADTAPAPTAH